MSFPFWTFPLKIAIAAFFYRTWLLSYNLRCLISVPFWNHEVNVRSWLHGATRRTLLFFSLMVRLEGELIEPALVDSFSLVIKGVSLRLLLLKVGVIIDKVIHHLREPLDLLMTFIDTLILLILHLIYQRMLPFDLLLQLVKMHLILVL